VEAITITLDGVEVSGYSGMTVLDLARESGVDIPTLCHNPNLIPIGACRLCLVEEEKSGALLAACVTPIRPEMTINTRSPRVLERRKTILQLILASHPDTCMVCDKGNNCDLRKLASDMGIGLIELQRIPQQAVIEEVNPFIERDLSKCILCAKCIRADHELVVEGAIDYLDRGFVSKPATLNDMPLEGSNCTFCGTCVAMCPTGALMEKEKAYHGATVSLVDTVCPYCGCGCSISLEVKDNRIIRARPGTNNQVNKETLCVRGCYGYDFVHHPDRLSNPLIWTEGEFQQTSWDEALELVADKFKQIKEKHGSDSLAVLGSSKCTNEENYLFQRFARGILGTNNIDNGSRLYSSASRIGLGATIGFPGTTNSIDELEQSQVILVIGADPAVSAPAVNYAIKRAVRYHGAKLLLIDPRSTKLSSFAHLWLKPKIGTDVALINGISNVIVQEELYDDEFVDRKTDNFSELLNVIKAFSPEKLEEITGVSRDDVLRTAHLFAQAERSSIAYGTGITQQCNGTDGVMALANLAMLTGNNGQQGGGIFALKKENNAQGACDMGALPDFLPGYQNLDDEQVKSKFEKKWGSVLPDKVGLTALEMIQQANSRKLKGLLIVGENPVASFPATSSVKKALESLEFLVVVDMFHTETAELANMVLPSASFAEKEGTFTNFEGRVQRVRKVIESFAESMPDSEIILKLAEKMDSSLPYSSIQQIRSEIEELVPLYQRRDYTGNDMESLDWADLDKSQLKNRRLYKGPFPSGFGRFHPVNYSRTENETSKDFPFLLVTGSILQHFGCGTRSSRASRLNKFVPQSWVEISRIDAEKLRHSDGDTVKVVSPSGGITCTIRVTDVLPAGMLFMPQSFPESNSNELFDIVLDVSSKTPASKRCAVKLERITENG